MHSAAYILGTFTILSAILAFLRDRLLAHTFGAGLSLDLYYAAFRVPDLIFVMVASLVSAYVLIPEFIRRSESQRAEYIETIMTYFSVVIVAVSAIAYMVAPWILENLFPTLVAQSGGGELLLMTRIMLLQPILLGFSNILATIIQARGRYVIYALSPLFYNFGIILGVLFLYPLFGLVGLAWGVVLGGFMHAMTAVPSVLADGFFARPLRIGNVGVFISTMKTSFPRTLALSANHLVLFVFIAIAGTLSAGSITVFSFAFNLQSVPIAIIGISYSVAAFPILAAAYAAGRHDEFAGYIRQAMRHIIFWMVPATALVIVLRAQIVRVILGSGAFDWSDTRLTAAVFALFALALSTQAAMPLLARAYYATGRSWVPFWVNGFAAVGAAIMGYVLVKIFIQGGPSLVFTEKLLRVSEVPGTEVLALPLAYAIASIFATLTLVYLFDREFGGLWSGLSRVFRESIIAAIAGGAVAYGVLNLVGGLGEATTFTLVLLHGFVAGCAGIGAIVIAYMVMRSNELREVYTALVARVRPQEASVALSAEDELS